MKQSKRTYKECSKTVRSFVNLLIWGLIFLFIPGHSSGTHISGGEITYKWISGNTFELTLTLYRDCSGIAAPKNPVINYSSVSCNKNLNVTLTKVPGTGQEITPTCSTAVTTCSGGTYTGIQEYKYTATVTLPSQCTDWKFGYTICCRNCAITTLNFNGCNNVPATYLEAMLNNVATPTNSSPVFTNIPVTFVCIGQVFNYNHGAYDQNGDSLVYALVSPRSASSTNVNFAPGYSSTNPVSSSPPVSINNSSGDIRMFPNTVQVAVMAVRVSEYRNGALIGSVIRDMEIWTQPCSNIIPVASGINGTNNFSIVACPEVPLNFNITSSDPNVGQVVTMDWNFGIPGATLNISGSPYPVGNFSWTPTKANARAQPYTFTVTVEDNNCPTRGFQSYSFSVYVPVVSVTASGTNSGCSMPGTGTVSAIGSGTPPLSYVWNSGGTGPTLSGLSPGTYTVTVTESQGCTSTATAVVGSTPPVSLSIAGSSNVTCYGLSNGSAVVQATGGKAPYTYSWSPYGGNAASANGLSAGTYQVTVTDANACTKSISVNIVQPAQLTASLLSKTDVLCHGDNTGTATMQVAGGTVPYSYFWNPGNSSTTTLNNVHSGSYTFTVTDAKGCSANSTVQISEPDALQVLFSGFIATCGNANGSAVATGVGGVPPYNYLWSTGENAPSISGLPGGGYSITITDANGCNVTDAITISNVIGPTLSIHSITQPICDGMSNGSAEVSVSSGTPPYNYQWSPYGGNGSNASGLGKGKYTVTVTDGNNCIAAVVVDIQPPPPITITFTSNAPECFGALTGSVLSSVSGGTGNYMYQWTPGGSQAANLSQASAGVYSLLVTDDAGCSGSAQVSLNQPSNLTAAVNALTPVSCEGGSDGSASVNVTGGSAPYNYEWFPYGGNNSFATGLAKGNYNVRITDAKNCSATLPVSISEPSALSAAGTLSPITCAGINNGAIQVSVNGGTAPYQFAWSTPHGNNSSATSLSPGNYSVTITDSKGCTTSVNSSIASPSPITPQLLNQHDVSCYGENDGSATISANGGLAPYTFTWNPSGIQTASSSSLGANVYNVTITDANQCAQGIVVAINQPALLENTLTVTTISCANGSDGSLEAEVLGGISPYSFLWSLVNDTTSVISNIPAGNYTVTVTDANHCTNTSSATLFEPPPLAITAQVTSPTCGNANGSITTNLTGGSPPYAYAWNPGGYTTGNLTNILSGTYTVIATDQNGCTSSQTVAVANPGSLSILPVITDVSCHGGNDGAVALNVTGGTAPYNYTWSQSGIASAAVNGLRAGNYDITVTDANACASIVSVMVNEPPAVQTTAAITPVTCPGGLDGSLTVSPAGGTPPYSFLWSHSGINSAALQSLPAGGYDLRITDSKGCHVQTQFTIQEPPAFSDSTLTSPAACGTSNGSASVFVSGGSPPYSYLWQPGGSTTSFNNNIPAGLYSVLITDSRNCSKTATVSLSNISGPVVNVSSLNDVSCSGGQDGSASVFVQHGTPPFVYAWFPSGNITPSATGLQAGNYTVQVTDANQCVTSLSLALAERSRIVSTTSINHLLCHGSKNGSAVVSASGGIAPYQYHWTNGSVSSVADSLTAGNYSVTITDAIGCSAISSIVINEPTDMTLSVNTTAVSCYGNSNGSAQVIAVGGSLPYSYEWFPSGGNAAQAFNLSEGNYIVRVHDANGCLDTISAEIHAPDQLQVSFYGSNVHCPGGSDGHANAIVNGGHSPFTYYWSTGAYTQVITGLPGGNYTVNITDSNGCSLTESVMISEPPPVVVIPDPIPVLCIGQSLTLSAQVSGGTQPYTYHWSNGIQTAQQMVSPVQSENYQLQIVDANNCPAPLIPFNVTVHPRLLVGNTSMHTICAGESLALSVSAFGGNGGPYTYVWNDGNTGSMIKVSPALSTTYTVSVSDNCTIDTVSASIPVHVQPLPGAQFLPVTMIGCAPLQVSLLDLNVNCNACLYEWDFGDGHSTSAGNANHVYENPGSYTVSHKVTDSYGCSNSVTVQNAVVVFPVPVALFTASPETLSIVNPVVSFYNQSVNEKVWSWNFGDGKGVSAIENPQYTFEDTGTYIIQLIVNSEHECADTSYKKIRVRDEFGIYIPNAFSPNGDGINDFFIPLTIGVYEFEMLIYDRWGMKIYETNDLLKPWDGTVQGHERPCQSDVYVYMVNVKTHSGETKPFVGHVSIVR